MCLWLLDFVFQNYVIYYYLLRDTSMYQTALTIHCYLILHLHEVGIITQFYRRKTEAQWSYSICPSPLSHKEQSWGSGSAHLQEPVPLTTALHTSHPLTGGQVEKRSSSTLCTQRQGAEDCPGKWWEVWATCGHWEGGTDEPEWGPLRVLCPHL